MKSIEEFLSELRKLKVNLSTEAISGTSPQEYRLRCKAPPETLTSALLQELKEHKAEILAFLQQVDIAINTNLSPILPVPRDKDLPLSFSQTRLWFLDQLKPGNSTYNIPAAYRLTGVLNIAALEQSLNEIVQRHEVLRTIFPSVDRQSSQVILPIVLTLPIIDLRDCPKSEIEVNVQQIATAEAEKPFNLATETLFRVKLLRLAEAEYVLLLNMHHIISDGWSFDVFFQELAALYTAFSTDNPSPLPELPIQYVDFAHWQRQCLSSEVLESQLNYWKQQLGGNLPLLQLPTDYPRPPVQTNLGAYQSLELSLDLTKALKALSQKEGGTLFMILLAAFQTLLCRYSGQEDIIIGTPISGRNQVETEGLIGFFVNTLAIRTNLSGNPSFRQLLSQVREVILKAYDHQDLPLEKLIEELRPERDLSRSPLFQVMFALQNTPSQPRELLGLTITPLEVHSGTAKFDLTLTLEETSEGIKGRIEYNTELFNPATIARMMRHFSTLLESIVANPEQRLSDLPLLTAEEHYQLLVEWNSTQTEYPNNTCIHQLFEVQVERTPDAIAVVFNNQQLTYQQLNHRANQLAHHLQKLGVKPEVTVGICLNRSLEMLVALLGILKAGGAYVPLDPDYPTERLTFILEDTQVPILLTQQSLVKKLSSNQAQVICLDAATENLRNQSKDNPTCKATADNLAYVIYTSGSTGKPKGVAVTHRAVTRLLFNTNYIKLEPYDKIAQISNTSFDAATFEIWGALLHGAKLVVIPKDVLLSPQNFAVQLCEQEISVLFLTTALFNQLTSAVPQAFKKLRYLLFGGEAVAPRWVKEILKKAPPQRLLHVYGPTENTTFSSCYWIQDVPEGATTLPIGRPISNTQIYILDPHLNPVPIGVSGELYIGGDGLARGYLNRPELNEEKFIPNPFNTPKSQIPNSKLYKTGDLARYLPDGNIEFLGRIDNQVKIRGFRIELGEIEVVLSQHPFVKQTVVIDREDALGDKRLVAYLVPSNQASISNQKSKIPNQLREFLKQKLPDYMIPSTFVVLETLPLTPNGKVDRLALPAPDLTRQDSEKTLVAPQDELELQLTKIWEKVMGIQPISVRDNFFNLGGHSLLAVKLFAEIEKTFKINLPLATLFQAPTVEELAKVLRHQEGTSPWLDDKCSTLGSSLVPIQPKGSKSPLFCIGGIDGNVFFYNKLSHYLSSDQPFYGLEPPGIDGKQSPLTRIEDIAAHYIQEMQTLQPEGPYFIGGFSMGTKVVWEMAHQLHQQGQQVALLALFDSEAFHGSIKRLPFGKRIIIHWTNLLRLGPTYIIQKKSGWSQWLKERLQYRLKKESLKFHKIFGFPLSYGLEQFAIEESLLEAGLQALRYYVPKMFLGRAVLFHATENMIDQGVGYYDYIRESDYGWGKLAEGGVEVYEIEGDHQSIFKEPSVQILADKLRVCIDKALTETKGEQSEIMRPEK